MKANIVKIGVKQHLLNSKIEEEDE